MPHPKRRHSSVRRDKRRTHYKAELPNVSICPVTQTHHLWHRAYVVDGDLYYKGKKMIENYEKSAKTEQN